MPRTPIENAHATGAGRWFWRFMLWSERMHPVAIFALGLSAVGVVTAVTAFVPSGLRLDELYLAPIVAVAWLTRSTRAGLLLAAVALVLGMTLATDFYTARVLAASADAVVHAVRYTLIVLLLALVRRDRDQLETLTVTDALTGAANLRDFRVFAERELERCRRHSRVLSLVYIDVDDFKLVNDRFGHREGDGVLKALARAAQGSVRSIDLVARMGGDEFAVLMPETTEWEAREVARRLRAAFSGIATPDGRPVTASMGVVTHLRPPASVDSLLEEADRAMYAAKAGVRSSRQDVARETRLVGGAAEAL